jgi:hypothetical protein
MNDTPNPPAFPAPDFARSSTHEGMTLRDYFASKAMQAVIANMLWPSDEDDMDYVAKHSYLMADAMLEARAK